MTIIVIIWLGLAVATGAAARSRGRDGFGWFLLAVIVSPVVALILLMAFQPKMAGPAKICKFCRSQVDAAAIVCPHCRRDIDTAEEIATREDTAIRKGNRRALAVLGGFAVFILVAVALASRP
jgi:hypothetical protein